VSWLFIRTPLKPRATAAAARWGRSYAAARGSRRRLRSGSTPAISRDGMKNTDHFFRVTKDKPGHNNFASHNIPRQTVRGDRYFNRTDQATPQDTYGITAVRRQHSLTSMR